MKNKSKWFVIVLAMLVTFNGCGGTVPPQPLTIIDDNYRNYYEIFVGSFYDSNGDGVGDLQGIIEKLD